MLNISSILIAEDDDDDRLLMGEAFEENGIHRKQLLFVSDGQELLDHLENHSRQPSLILLDMNMPKKDGRQTLFEIKSNPKIKHLPVIIFSTSNSRADIKSLYEMGVSTYFTKPSSYRDLVEIIAVIKLYWCEKAALPGY